MLAMRIVFLVALLIVVDSALAQSKQESTAHDKGATTKQHGSRDNPLFINILPAPDADKRAKEDKEDRNAKRKADEKLVEFTGQVAEYTDKLAGYTKFLVGIGIVQCLIFIFQLIVFTLQARRLREAVESQERTERAILFLGALEPIIFPTSAVDKPYPGSAEAPFPRIGYS